MVASVTIFTGFMVKSVAILTGLVITPQAETINKIPKTKYRINQDTLFFLVKLISF